MAELNRVDAPMSPFAEARAWIDKWEKQYPDTHYFAIIVNVPDGFEFAITGESNVSEAAGIFFRAAQLAAE